MPNPNSASVRGPDRRTTDRRSATQSLDRLLDGAQATFAERGYNAANIHEICARSNVGIGTFYAHFDRKHELLKQVCVDRVRPLSDILTPPDLLDHGRLVAVLRRVADEPMAAGMLRAWYEAVLEEPAIARFHAEWRSASLKDLAVTVAEAQRAAPSPGVRRDPSVIAWTIATLAREMAIYDRNGAPDLDALARLFRDLVYGPELPD